MPTREEELAAIDAELAELDTQDAFEEREARKQTIDRLDALKLNALQGLTLDQAERFFDPQTKQDLELAQEKFPELSAIADVGGQAVQGFALGGAGSLLARGGKFAKGLRELLLFGEGAANKAVDLDEGEGLLEVLTHGALGRGTAELTKAIGSLFKSDPNITKAARSKRLDAKSTRIAQEGDRSKAKAILNAGGQPVKQVVQGVDNLGNPIQREVVTGLNVPPQNFDRLQVNLQEITADTEEKIRKNLRKNSNVVSKFLQSNPSQFAAAAAGPAITEAGTEKALEVAGQEDLIDNIVQEGKAQFFEGVARATK